MTVVKQQLQVELNGENRAIPPVESLRDLLKHLQIAEERVAVEVNRKIIRKADWSSTPVRDRDKIEIVQFVGGG